jgi:hypothetical protein
MWPEMKDQFAEDANDFSHQHGNEDDSAHDGE